MPRHSPRHLAPVAPIGVLARQSAVHVVQHQAVAKIDPGVVRYTVLGSDLHEDQVAALHGLVRTDDAEPGVR